MNVIQQKYAGYGSMRGTIGSYRLGNNVNNNGDLISSSSRLKRQMSSSSLGMLPRISEIEPVTVELGVLNDASDYPFGSWEHDSSPFIDNFTGLKREIETRVLFIKTHLGFLTSLSYCSCYTML